VAIQMVRFQHRVLDQSFDGTTDIVIPKPAGLARLLTEPSATLPSNVADALKAIIAFCLLNCSDSRLSCQYRHARS
jgi:hypothetical protein